MDYLKDEIIEKYVDGTLSTAEKQDFEQTLKNNTQLQKAVKRKKETIQIIREMGDLQLSERIKKIVEEEMPHIQTAAPKIARRRWLYVLSAAAAVLLLVFAYGVFFQAPSQERLFAQHYKPYTISTARNATSAKSSFKEGRKAYRAKNYELALNYFQEVSPSESNYFKQASIASGICYLELGQYTQALQQFQSLQDADSDYTVQWYIGLSHLKMNDKSNSQRAFERLTKENNPYKQKSETILQILKEIEE